MDLSQIIYFFATLVAMVILFGGMHVRMSHMEGQIRELRSRVDGVPLWNTGRSEDHD